MDILVVGGSGFIGSALKSELESAGHDVTISTRKETNSLNMLTWNPPEIISPEKISAFEAIVNLAGESVFRGRWTRAKKDQIRSSRIDTTRALVESLRNAEKRPAVLINASAVGYYGSHGDENVTEDIPGGKDFLAEVCKEWEQEAHRADEIGIRVVITRFGIVLGTGGGALSMMLTPFKAFIGGYVGSGNQWMSWIHIDDVTGFIRYAIENESVSGIYNVAAPNPVTNKDFSSALGKALGRPSIFPVPGFALKAALGEFGEVLLTGQKVISQRALRAGYQFKFIDLNKTLKVILVK